MQKQTVAFSKDSSNLFFHILTRCNLSCSHCYINKEQHGSNTLDIKTIKEWLNLFASNATRTNLIFLGGEPTLHPDLSDAVTYARQCRFNSITIDTNGYLFHNILDKISCKDVDFLSFSLDGATPETNDAIRGKNCFDTVTKGILSARKRGFSCSMIYTVSGKNIHELEQMPELIKRLGIERFFIQVIGIRGENSNHNSQIQVSKQLWLDTVPKVAEQIAGQGVIVTYPKVFLTVDEPFQCAGKVADNYFIFPNARVYRCPICEDYPLHAYTIENNRLKKRPKINEAQLFDLAIPEGCVMNKLIQEKNLVYTAAGNPEYQIACCMLKEEIYP